MLSKDFIKAVDSISSPCQVMSLLCSCNFSAVSPSVASSKIFLTSFLNNSDSSRAQAGFKKDAHKTALLANQDIAIRLIAYHRASFKHQFEN